MTTLERRRRRRLSPVLFYGPSYLFGLGGPVEETLLAKFAYGGSAGKGLFDELEVIAGISHPV